MSEHSGMNFRNFNNCVWNVVITLSSVGYGEFYPVTFFGRIIGIIICFWGVFIVSMFVLIVSNILEFEYQETKAYDMVISLYYKL
jgi:hypothetical protein